MIVSTYFVGGGLWRLLNINLFITSARPLKSIFSLRGPYMELVVPSSFYRVDAGLHALNFSSGFNVYKLYLK
jgi:hypothetical protein